MRPVTLDSIGSAWEAIGDEYFRRLMLDKAKAAYRRAMPFLEAADWADVRHNYATIDRETSKQTQDMYMVNYPDRILKRVNNLKSRFERVARYEAAMQ